MCLLESQAMKRGQEARDCTRAFRKQELPMLASPGITSEGEPEIVTP